MRRYSTSYIKEMQIKTIKYHYGPMRMAETQDTGKARCWRGCGPWDPSLAVGGNAMVQPLRKTVASYETERTLPIQSGNSIFGIYPKELNIYVLKRCMQIFPEALSILANACKNQDALQEASEEVKGGTSRQRGNYSALKRNELRSHGRTWKNTGEPQMPITKWKMIRTFKLK